MCAVSYALVEEAVLRFEGKRQVLSLEPTNLGGILSSIEQVADATGVPDRATAVVTALRRRIEAVSAEAGDVAAGPRVLAVEWLDPLFTAGHWVPEMIRLAGGRDVLGIEGRPLDAGRVVPGLGWRSGRHRADAVRVHPGADRG